MRFKETYIDIVLFGYADYISNKHGPRARTQVIY